MINVVEPVSISRFLPAGEAEKKKKKMTDDTFILFKTQSS